jgi:hypothetical protein
MHHEHMLTNGGSHKQEQSLFEPGNTVDTVLMALPAPPPTLQAREASAQAKEEELDRMRASLELEISRVSGVTHELSELKGAHARLKGESAQVCVRVRRHASCVRMMPLQCLVAPAVLLVWGGVGWGGVG